MNSDYKNFNEAVSSMDRIKELNILYVEDDIKNQIVISKALKLYCNNVFVAGDGEEALFLYECNKNILDILIVDISLPKINGIDVIKSIRKENKTIPIIITTAHTDKEYLLEALKLKLDSYIIKPFSFEKLMLVLEEYIQRIYGLTSLIKVNEDFELNVTMKSIIIKEEVIFLEPKEFKFLFLLIKNINKIIAYDIIEHYVYGEQNMSKSAIRTIVSNLNRKLQKKYIQNYSNEGYMLFVK